MDVDWPSVPLSELVDLQRGISYGIVQPGSPVLDGVPIVRVSDVRNGRIVNGGSKSGQRGGVKPGH